MKWYSNPHLKSSAHGIDDVDRFRDETCDEGGEGIVKYGSCSSLFSDEIEDVGDRSYF